MFSFKEILEKVNSEIEKISWERPPYALYKPIEYILSLGGKRVRPAITLMACNLYAENITSAIKPALGLEIFHNFTLLHDDIMDKAEMRRGKPTVHKKWSDNTAILSGDVMQIEAYKWVAETPEKYLKKTLDAFSKTAAEICEGQQLDMEFEQRNNVSENEYIEMIRLKTAVLIATGCQIGAWIGGATDEDAQTLYDFGCNIGLAFQLKDDLLDVYGNAKTFGKRIGGDILCNKKTFLLINALHLAKDKDTETLNYWLNQNNPAYEKEKISGVTAIYNRIGAKNICEDKMNYFYTKALTCLDNVSISQEKKNELQKLAAILMDRID